MKKPLGFLASVLAGISLGMLFAPKAGKQLRKDLGSSSDKAGTFGRQLLGAAEDASSEVKKFLHKKEIQDLLASGKAEVEGLWEVAKQKGIDLSAAAKSEIREMAENLGYEAKAAKSSVKNRAKTAKRRVAKKAQNVKK